MIILGIDPGFRYAGYSIIKKEGTRAILIECDYLSLPPTKTLVERLGIFYAFFSAKVTQWSVTHLALETPFLGKNAQNFLKLGYLRGNLYLIAHQHALTLQEFAPREVKQAVTGWGGASKDQVATIMLQLFPGLKKPKREDVTDALAVTVTALWRLKTGPQSSQPR
jgi:crossover junction endodeoxyribonuclease RuvC